jgi:hydroxyacylglutathione hydrolase
VHANGGDVLSLGESSFRVIHTPGHTTGHCAYYFEAAKAAFVGDTLFSLGAPFAVA